MNTSKSLNTYTKITLGTAGALTAVSNSDAAILYFDIIPDANIPNFGSFSAGDIDLFTETYTLGSSAGNYFGFDPVNNGMYWGGSVNQAVGPIGFSTGALPLAYGDSIDAARTWASYGSAYVGGASPWVDGENIYVGLRLDAGGGDYNYGWMNMTFNVNAGAVVTGFAFEKDLNTAILAGDTGGGPVPVPEPGQVAASLLLLAGIAGYFALRRRAGSSTEPNGLHALALGARGIEEFRKNKAA